MTTYEYIIFRRNKKQKKKKTQIANEEPNDVKQTDNNNNNVLTTQENNVDDMKSTARETLITPTPNTQAVNVDRIYDCHQDDTKANQSQQSYQQLFNQQQVLHPNNSASKERLKGAEQKQTK